MCSIPIASSSLLESTLCLSEDQLQTAQLVFRRYSSPHKHPLGRADVVVVVDDDDDQSEDHPDSNAHLSITREGYILASIALVGVKPSAFELEQLFPEKMGSIDYQTYLEGVAHKLRRTDRNVEIRQIFKAFDLSDHGFLTIEDIKEAFLRVAPHVSAEVVEDVFRVVDKDKDGRVSFRDFDDMMRTCS